MGLESVSESEDVIGDLHSQWATPLQKNHIESTYGPHVARMFSHVAHVCYSNFTRLLTCDETFSQAREKLLNGCRKWKNFEIALTEKSH